MTFFCRSRRADSKYVNILHRSNYQIMIIRTFGYWLYWLYYQYLGPDPDPKANFNRYLEFSSIHFALLIDSCYKKVWGLLDPFSLISPKFFVDLRFTKMH